MSSGFKYHLGPSTTLKGDGTKEELLVQSGKVFVMDNHRLAPWCWLQVWDAAGTIDLFHFDWHWDMAPGTVDDDLRNVLSPRISLEAYRSETRLTYDNYLTCFLETYGEQIDLLVCSAAQTKDDYTPPDWFAERIITVSPRQMLQMLGRRTDWPLTNRSIINIDLDLFQRPSDADEDTSEFHSQEEADRCAELMGKWLGSVLDDNNCMAATIALSPSWIKMVPDSTAEAQRLLGLLFQGADLLVPQIIRAGSG